MKGRELTSEHKKSISRSQTGKSPSSLTKEKISKAISSNHPFKGLKVFIDCVRRLIAYNFSTSSIKKARQSMNH